MMTTKHLYITDMYNSIGAKLLIFHIQRYLHLLAMRRKLLLSTEYLCAAVQICQCSFVRRTVSIDTENFKEMFLLTVPYFSVDISCGKYACILYN